MTWRTLYQLHFVPDFIWGMSVAVPLVLFLFFAAAWRQRQKQGEGGLLRASIAPVFCLLAMLAMLFSPLCDHGALKAALEQGACRTAEGVVTEYARQTPGNGIYYERFTLDGVPFSYHDWGYFPGYHRCGSVLHRSAGIITGNGQRLRITYVPDWPWEGGAVNAIVCVAEPSTPSSVWRSRRLKISI